MVSASGSDQYRCDQRVSEQFQLSGGWTSRSYLLWLSWTANHSVKSYLRLEADPENVLCSSWSKLQNLIRFRVITLFGAHEDESHCLIKYFPLEL